MRLKGQLPVVENRTTACIFPHLFFVPLKHCNWKRISKGSGKAQEKMARRTPVYLTGFSIVQRCPICIYTQQKRHKQRMAANSGFFFLMHSRSQCNTRNIWETEPSDDNYRNPAREKNARGRPDGNAIINPTSARVLSTPSPSLPVRGEW